MVDGGISNHKMKRALCFSDYKNHVFVINNLGNEDKNMKKKKHETNLEITIAIISMQFFYTSFNIYIILYLSFFF